jgi:hypothetical protein
LQAPSNKLTRGRTLFSAEQMRALEREAFDFLRSAKSADKTNSTSRVSASHFLANSLRRARSIINLLFLDIFAQAVLREKRHEYNHKSIAHTQFKPLPLSRLPRNCMKAGGKRERQRVAHTQAVKIRQIKIRLLRRLPSPCVTLNGSNAG